MSELDWSTSRKRKDFDGVERIAVPLGEGLIVSLLVRQTSESGECTLVDTTIQSIRATAREVPVAELTSNLPVRPFV
jgi:hypothetical protein